MTTPAALPVPATVSIAGRIAPDLIALRRQLHADPELGLELPRTQQRVLDQLAGLDLQVSTGTGLSSVTAVLRGGRRTDDSPVVLLRGDMDGLPVTENTALDYASTNGAMHACGHDLHVAALVGAATILGELRDELAGDVVFMFQPAEEGPGGAQPMIDEGLLTAAGRPVDAAFALHVGAAGEPKHMWFGRPGPLMSAADECVVTVVGAGGHGSQPHNAKDPVPVACEIVLALQTMVTRRFDAFDPVVVTVGKITGGTKDNIIPDTATLDATIRTFSTANRERIEREITQVVNGICAAHGMTPKLFYRNGYPVTVNDQTEYALLVQTVIDLFGSDNYHLMPNPEAGSEDFSFVAEKVPSAYIFLSACTAADPMTAPDNHSALAEFDDSVVPDAAALLAEVAIRRLRLGRQPVV